MRCRARRPETSSGTSRKPGRMSAAAPGRHAPASPKCRDCRCYTEKTISRSPSGDHLGSQSGVGSVASASSCHRQPGAARDPVPAPVRANGQLLPVGRQVEELDWRVPTSAAGRRPTWPAGPRELGPARRSTPGRPAIRHPLFVRRKRGGGDAEAGRDDERFPHGRATCCDLLLPEIHDPAAVRDVEDRAPILPPRRAPDVAEPVGQGNSLAARDSNSPQPRHLWRPPPPPHTQTDRRPASCSNPRSRGDRARATQPGPSPVIPARVPLPCFRHPGGRIRRAALHLLTTAAHWMAVNAPTPG